MQPPIEVLVVSYASTEVIARLLASLVETLPGVPVAVREHAPEPAAVAALEQLAAAHPAAVRVEHDPSNPGFGAGCNALAAGSEATFLLFLNPDTEVVRWPWSDTPIPGGTVFGPVMVEDAHQHYGRTYRIRDEIALSWLRRRPQPPTGSGYVSGAALLIERREFTRLGGFDPGFFMFYEDIDLCLRANAAGVRTLVEPGWIVRHARHHSTRSRVGASLVWSYESALRFYAKHGSPVWAYRLYKAVDASLRSAMHCVRGNRANARAYAQLARRAMTG